MRAADEGNGGRSKVEMQIQPDGSRLKERASGSFIFI